MRGKINVTLRRRETSAVGRYRLTWRLPGELTMFMMVHCQTADAVSAALVRLQQDCPEHDIRVIEDVTSEYLAPKGVAK